MTEAPFNIVSLFIKTAMAKPDVAALRSDKEEMTYKNLLEAVKVTAAHYRNKGIGKRDAVLVFVPMSIDLYRIVLALFWLGAVPVFLDEWVSRKRLALCCAVVPCKGMIASRKMLFASFFMASLRNIPVKLPADAKSAGAIGDPPVQTAPGDTALVTFTTGTTGWPKAADRTHAFLSAQLQALQPLLDRDHQTSLTLLPIVVLANLGLGRTTLLPPRAFKMKDPATVSLLVSLLHAQQPEAIIASPSVLIEIAGQLKGEECGFVQQVITGGGAVFPDGAQKMLTAFPSAETTVVYGSTEAEPISRIDMKLLAAVPDPILLGKGLPVGKPELELAIIPISDQPIPFLSEADWQSMQAERGEAGEIVVSGAHVLASYLHNPEAVSRQKIRVGEKTWHRTGDAGRLDEEGHLYLLGRCNEMAVLDGKPVYPLIAAYLLGRAIGREAAIIQTASQLFAVLEGKPLPHDAVLPALESLGLRGAIIRFIPLIPKDPRHRTKTDTEKLRAWLEERS